jgi:hypothetical protein
MPNALGWLFLIVLAFNAGFLTACVLAANTHRNRSK